MSSEDFLTPLKKKEEFTKWNDESVLHPIDQFQNQVKSSDWVSVWLRMRTLFIPLSVGRCLGSVPVRYSLSVNSFIQRSGTQFVFQVLPVHLAETCFRVFLLYDTPPPLTIPLPLLSLSPSPSLLMRIVDHRECLFFGSVLN